MKNKATLVLLLAALVVAFSACSQQPRSAYVSDGWGAAQNDSMFEYSSALSNRDLNSFAEAPEYEMSDTAYFTATGIPLASQIQPEKIIQTAELTVQTDKFDETAARIKNIAELYGGFIENANLQGGERNRQLNVTLRVPAEFFEEALKYAERQGKVISSNQWAENVTSQYYDIASRLETKLIEEERVLGMIDRAEKVDDLLALERRLGEIRSQIELFQSQMNNIDRLASFSTIRVYLREVTTEALELVSEGLGGRIQQAFVSSANGVARFFQNFVIFLAAAVIPLAVIAVPVCGAFFAYRFSKRKRKAKNK